MRISDWSSDVCSSDLAVSSTNMARLPQNVSENSGLTENSTVTAIPFSAINIPLLSVCMDHQPTQRAVGICSVVRYHRPAPGPSCRSEEHPSEPQSVMGILYAVVC